MGKFKKQTVGYSYYMGIHMGMGRGPIDELLEIQVGGLKAWEGSMTANGSFKIDKANLFGGTKGEGGIKGTFDLMMGGPDQVMSTGLRKMLQGNQPQFRGVVSGFFDGLVCAMSPYPKAWTFRLRRILAGWDGGVWYGEKATIPMTGYDSDGNSRTVLAMNGVHIIYEALTNRAWGLGRDRSLFLEDSWREAADTCFDENFGLCLRWSRQDTLMSFVQTVIDHIGAAVYVDKFTGQYKIKLIREDYDADSLPVLDMDSGLLSIDEATNASPYNLTNEIVVNWNNPITNEASQAREHNLALIQTQGAIASDTRDYPGVPTAALALWIAKRDLKTVSTNVRRFTLTCDRRTWRVQPADVLKIRDPQSRGIETVVVRIGTVEEAGQADGKIKIVCVQDVFGVDLNTFGQPQPPGHVEPDFTPQVARRLVYESTYSELVRYMPQGEFETMRGLEGYLRAHAEKPTDVSMSFDIAVRPEGQTSYSVQGSGDFTALAELTTQISYLDTILILDNYSLDFDWEELEVGMTIHVNEEMMRLDGWDEEKGEFYVGRGAVDTIPQRHFGGDLVWLVQDVGGSDWVKYLSGEHLDIKLLPWTLRGGSFPIDDAPVDTLDMNHRFIRPYPPGFVRTTTLAGGEKRWYEVQDLRADVGADEIPDYLDIHYTHRDRVVQQDKLVEHNEGDIGPEPGQTYRVRVFDNTGQLVRTETGIAGTRYVYTYANAAADTQVEAGSPESTTGTIFLDSMRAGYESWQYYTINFVVHKKPPQMAQVAMFTMAATSEPSEADGDAYDDTAQAEVAQMSMQTAQGDTAIESGEDDTSGVTVAAMSESASQTTKLPPVIDVYLYEAPYLTLLRDGRDADSSQVMAFVARPSDRLTDGFDLFDRTAGDTSWRANGSQPWTPWGQLSGFIAPLTNEFDVGTTSDLDGVPIGGVYAGDVLLVDNELMVVESVDGKRIKVGRGAVDTIPAVHYGGVVVWLFDRAHAAANHLYGDNEGAEVVVVPHSYSAPLTADDMPVRQLQMQYRPKRPYPPGMMLANGKHWFERVDARADNFDAYNPQAKDVIFTWAHRNRLSQDDVAYDHFASGIKPEEGVQYRIWIGYTSSGTNKVTLATVYTADAGWVLSAAQAKALGERAGRALKAEGYVQVQMAINAVRDGLYNWQGYAFNVMLPSTPLNPGATPGGNTETPDPTYPPEGTPNPTPNPTPGDTGGDGGTTDPQPDPQNPDPNPDPDVPDTDPPAPEPTPQPDPENVFGWSLNWDHGWAADLPAQTTKGT